VRNPRARVEFEIGLEGKNIFYVIVALHLGAPDLGVGEKVLDGGNGWNLKSMHLACLSLIFRQGQHKVENS
jgi:hypothetical protein